MKINSLEEARQFAFETSVRGLASQDWEQCARNGDECQWNLGKPGFHCALGWLIPWPNQQNCTQGNPGLIQDIAGNWNSNPAYSNRGKLIPELREWVEFCSDSDRIEFFDFLRALQQAHDCSSGKESMKQSFLRGEKITGVTWPEDVSR
jgi:hypothetical protein